MQPQPQPHPSGGGGGPFPGGPMHPQQPPPPPQQHMMGGPHHPHQQQAAASALQAMRKRAQADSLVGAGIKGAKRGRPTTRALPPSITRTIPESALYSDLVRMERALDWTVTRKRAEIQDGLGRNTKLKRTLRIFLSNTCANQPFQVEARREEERKKEEAKDTQRGRNVDAAAGGEEDSIMDAVGLTTTAGGAGRAEDEAKANVMAPADEKKPGDAEQSKSKERAPVKPDEIASWTLRIEGRILEPNFRSRAHNAQSLQATQARTAATKFSNMIKSVVVELIRDPTLYPAGDNIVEWHRPTPSVPPPSANMPPAGENAIPGSGNALDAPTVPIAEPALDGFEIKRTGTVPVKARIVIYLAHVPERYALSPELGALLNIREETRQSVIAALWAYIKERKLLSEEDRRIVLCDEPLQNIFRTPRIAFHHIPEVVNRHLHPSGPVVLEYWVRTDKEEYRHPTAFDVEVELEDSGLRNVQDDVLAGFDLHAQELAELDDRIAQATQTLENRTSTRDFLAAFARDPHNHLQTWMASQARDLNAILGQNYSSSEHLNLSKEELRRSETFRGDWVDQAVVRADCRPFLLWLPGLLTHEISLCSPSTDRARGAAHGRQATRPPAECRRASRRPTTRCRWHATHGRAPAPQRTVSGAGSE